MEADTDVYSIFIACHPHTQQGLLLNQVRLLACETKTNCIQMVQHKRILGATEGNNSHCRAIILTVSFQFVSLQHDVFVRR